MLWDRYRPWKKKELASNTATDYLFNGRQQTLFQNMLSKPIWEVSALLMRGWEGGGEEQERKKQEINCILLLLNQSLSLFKSNILLLDITQF